MANYPAARLAAISGTMPQWRRHAMTYLPWLMCLAFAYVMIQGRRIFEHIPAPKLALIVLPILIVATMVALIVLQLWYRHRTIAEIEYDGCTLRFQTIGRHEPEMRPLEDLADLSEWREWRGSRAAELPVTGYQLTFRDRQKVFLLFSVSNARELAARLQSDRWPDRS